MNDWTPDRVAERFSEAATTARALPPVIIPGYHNSWPAIRRLPQENLGAECILHRITPPPDAVDRMLEAMQWVRWLEEEQRHLVWMRAERYGWRKISQRFGCDRTTAWRRWQRALGLVAEHLNAVAPAARRQKNFGCVRPCAGS